MSTRENIAWIRHAEASAWHALNFAERAIEELPPDKRTYELLRILETIQRFRQLDSVRVQRMITEFPLPAVVTNDAHARIVATLTTERNQALVDTAKVATALAGVTDELRAAKEVIAAYEQLAASEKSALDAPTDRATAQPQPVASPN